jgi:hypothetical protein
MTSNITQNKTIHISSVQNGPGIIHGKSSIGFGATRESLNNALFSHDCDVAVVRVKRLRYRGIRRR